MSTPTSRSFRAGLPLFLAVLLLFAACSDDDDPVRPGSDADISGLVNLAGTMTEGATVYLAREPGFMPAAAPFVIDSTTTNADGLYEFDELDPWVYRVYAEVMGGKAGNTWLVSPFSGSITLDELNLPDKGAGKVADLALREVAFEGVVSGDVWYQGETAVPVDSTDVRLFWYTAGALVLTHETLTNATGHYAVAGVPTGNYTVFAMKMFEISAPFPVFVSGESEPFFCNGEGHVEAPRLWLYDSLVEKPAIYIYPEEPGPFSVTLDLNNGTRLAATEPEYDNGWKVDVAEDGRIDDQWDYLFYEVAIAVQPLLEQGWCLARTDLAAGLADIVTDFGLNEAERADFLEYWTTRLPRYDWYLVKPVLGPGLDTWVGLDVTPRPDTVLRFWLFFQGVSERVDIDPPSVPRMARTGTTVVEWGGALLPSRLE